MISIVPSGYEYEDSKLRRISSVAGYAWGARWFGPENLSLSRQFDRLFTVCNRN